MLRQWRFAIVQRQVPVGAHFPHLTGQQIGKLLTIRDGIVIAVLCVSPQRIRHLLGQVRVDVVLLKIRNRPINHAIALGRIELRVRSCRADNSLRLSILLFERRRHTRGLKRIR